MAILDTLIHYMDWQRSHSTESLDMKTLSARAGGGGVCGDARHAGPHAGGGGAAGHRALAAGARLLRGPAAQEVGSA